MRKILFTLVAIATCVMAGKSTNRHGPHRPDEIADHKACAKTCGVEMGNCIVETKDVDTCMKTAGTCGHKCLFGEKKHVKQDIKVTDIGSCEANCGIDYAKCMITTFALEDCLKQEAACALDCLKGLTVEEKKEVFVTQDLGGDIGQCNINCAIDYGKCMITTFALEQCIKDEASCALDCLKGLTVEEKKELNVQQEMGGDIGQCNINCAIEYGKCMITQGFALEVCAKQEAACALDCLKGLTVEEKKEVKVRQEMGGDIGQCNINCAIDYGKCMITTFALEQCIKDEAACALDCLKGGFVAVKNTKRPSMNTIKCSACQFAAGRVFEALMFEDCKKSQAKIENICYKAFGGRHEPTAKQCSEGFVKSCENVQSKIANKTFSTLNACIHIEMC